ncbi:MAG TPA: DUF4867 family protein [Candidatus Limiplasma sp.]|nr:DUF4867 family protein [Candidatus Limiplasma sp.]HPS82530.1 DUF4867 family protein [Candidatus Limiplasma sp.]
MDKLSTLREKNPGLPFHSVNDSAFSRFGRVVDFDASALIAACQKAAQMPNAGSQYVPDMPALETPELFHAVQHGLRGDGACQVGCCWGFNSALNCLEYHRAGEHNIAVTDMVVMLASQLDMVGLDLPEGKVEAFFVPAGTTIEFYATTLHYCPCHTEDSGFCSIVVLPRGTNHALTEPRPDGYDGRLLWAKDKWLIANPENRADVDAGAYPGLHGENFVIRY